MLTISTKPKIIIRGGKPKEVILDIKEYERLLENAEDKEDIAEMKRIKKARPLFARLKHN